MVERKGLEVAAKDDREVVVKGGLGQGAGVAKNGCKRGSGRGC